MIAIETSFPQPKPRRKALVVHALIALVAVILLGALTIDAVHVANSTAAANAVNRYQIWAAAATVAGVMFGIATIALGWFSFWETQRVARATHMHGLFRDFLRYRAEFRDGQASMDADGQLADQLGFRLYTLEEMWSWVRAEERLSIYRRDKDYIYGWTRTVRSHILEVKPAKLSRHLDKYADCYGQEFLRAVAGWSEDNDIRTVVNDEIAQRNDSSIAERSSRQAILPPEEADTA